MAEILRAVLIETDAAYGAGEFRYHGPQINAGWNDELRSRAEACASSRSAMNKKWRAYKRTAVTLAVAIACFLALFAAATPVCIWVSGSVDSCERMMCEILHMKRPHTDAATCQAWFDLFR
jgi:hypothetical protein